MKEYEKYMDTWLAIGRKNPWIKESYDPPFNKNSFGHCSSIEELEREIINTSWCLGTGFTLGNLCFINQVEGGSEWLTIKEDVSFESFSFDHVIKKGEFKAYIEAIQKATLEECKNLDYMKHYKKPSPEEKELANIKYKYRRFWW